jgi:hypothetical protein
MAAIVALLAATGMVWLTSLSGHHVASGDEAGQVSIDTVNVFNDEPGAQPPVQVSTATVTNTSSSAVHITNVELTTDTPPNSGEEGINAIGASDSSEPTTTTGPPPIPFDIFPGENCKGVTLQPEQICMVSVRYTVPQTPFTGSVKVTFEDGSDVLGGLGANQRQLDSIVADPYVVDFGTRKVGTTSPTQTVTISASPDNTDYQIVKVSVVDTVPTPGDKADYAILSDGCTGQQLQLGEIFNATGGTSDLPVENCPIQVTDTPGGSGARPAFLNVSYCDGDTENDEASGPDLQFAQQNAAADDSEPPSDSASASDTPTTTAPPPPPDPEIFCPNDEEQESFHQLVALNGAGEATTTTTTPPPTTTTTTPPPPPTTTTAPPAVFTPTLTATPPLAPAGRTTQVSGTGFPTNTQVVFALVALNTPPDSDLANVPAVAKTNTDGNGDFKNQVMLIMPHLPPGHYEILAQAQIGKSPVTATVNFLVAPGSQEPPKFAGRH